MNLNILHDITFYALYAALAIAVFVAIERLIFFLTTSRRTRELEDAVEHGQAPPAALINASNVPAKASKHMLERLPSVRSRHDLEDLSEEVFIDAQTELKKHLYSEEGKLRAFVNVYLNDEDIRYLSDKENTAVKDSDSLSIIPSIAGGCVVLSK